MESQPAMSPHAVLWILIALGIVWTIGWAMVLVRSTRAPALAERDLERSETRVRLTLLALFASAGLVLFLLTLGWLPYHGSRVAHVGQPQVTVNVTGVQWAWMLSRHRLPAGIPIQFDVRGADVNHDFGIYDPQGRLVAQVQAMPGYVNRLVHVFRTPGSYTVRCLEYCGIAHHEMISSFTVAAP